MVTIQEQINEARQSLRRGREELSEREEELEEFRSKAQRIKAPRRSIRFQLEGLAPYRRSIEEAGGIERVSGRFRRQREEALQIAREQEGRIREARGEIGQRERELNVIEGRVRREERRERRGRTEVFQISRKRAETQQQSDLERLGITRRAQEAGKGRIVLQKRPRESRFRKAERGLGRLVTGIIQPRTFIGAGGKILRPEAKSFGQEFGKSPVRTVEFGTLLVRRPKRTVKEAGSGLKQTGKDIISGEAGRKIRTFARKDPAGFAGRVAGEVATFRASSSVFAKAPSVTGGLVARTGATGRFRGIKTRTLPTGAKERFIETPQGDIGLIPEAGGKQRFSSTDPATVRGAFGYSEREQASFLGQKGVATSQRGLIPRMSQTGRLRDYPPKRGLGLFGTPADPTTGNLQTRVSRLGESPKGAGIKDILSGNVSFRGQGQPQIIVFPKERAGRRGGFEKIPQQFRSGELEVATKAPSFGGARKVRRVRRLGVTVVGGVFGRRVPIIEAELDTARAIRGRLPKPRRTRAGQRQLTLSVLDEKPRFPTSALSSRAVGRSRISVSRLGRPSTRPPRRGGRSILFPPTSRPPTSRPPRTPPSRPPNRGFRFGGVPSVPSLPPFRNPSFTPTPRRKFRLTQSVLRRSTPLRKKGRSLVAIRPSFTGAVRFNVIGARGSLRPQLGKRGFLPTVRPVPFKI